MAVVITKSAGLTNRDSLPSVLNNPPTGIGMLRESVGTVELANGDSIASQYRFCQVPSNARISAVRVMCDKLGTTTALNLGLYRTTADGGTVVNATFFASALDVHTAALPTTDVTHQSTVYDITMVERPLWVNLGLSADPGVFYDVVATLTAASDVTPPASTLSVKVSYVI